MQKMGMTAAHRQQAIAWFKQGAEPGFDSGPTYQRFMSVCGQTRNLKYVLLVYLVVMALADGQLHAAEEAVLFDIAARVGYDRATFQQLLDMVLNKSHFAGGGKATSPAALDDAYKALGVTKDSTDQEVKRAYRKQMSQYHPDKLIGQGLPEDMIAMATEQSKEIQHAYELIKKSRNI